MESMSSPSTPFASEEARLESFRRALDAIHAREKAAMGQADLEQMRRLDNFSHSLGWIGRGLIAFTPGPIGFVLGVGALFVHKQLQATEIGHTVLHGCYDRIVCERQGAEHNLRSETWTWLVPIDEASWRHEHNVKHHQYTNIVGRDPDTRFGHVRLNAHVEHKEHHRFQLVGGLVSWLSFGFWMNTHATGLTDAWLHESGDYDVIDADDPEQVRGAYGRAWGKFRRYYAKELLLYPLMTGPFFFRALLGNVITELMRDLYSAATIWCGHIGEETAAFPKGTRSGGRARWYEMQVEATNNFEVPLPISMLCGGLDKQIEHHLFPRLPPARLRSIAPEVRAICEAHGVRYRSAGWGRTLVQALREVLRLQRPDAEPRAAYSGPGQGRAPGSAGTPRPASAHAA